LKLPLSLSLALRDLRSGLAGLRIFIVCIILGVGAIATIGSLSEAVEQGLERQGQPLLGGDLEIALVHLPLAEHERRTLETWGRVSEIATLRAMASAGDRHALVEIKSVDGNYPLYGALELAEGKALAAALAPRNGRHGIAVDPLLLDRLNLRVGQELTIGEARFELRASIAREPDRIADGFVLGPRVLMTPSALAAAKLLKAGSLVSWKYRLKLSRPAAYQQIAEVIKGRFADRGWRIRDRGEAAPGVKRYLERLEFFLNLVGLTSIAIGGVGIANAVKTFIARRRRQIAILRLIGTPAHTVFLTYLCEIMLVTLLALGFALSLGALLPWAIAEIFQARLPIPLHTAVHVKPLLIAFFFGLLTAFVFSLWPLSQAKAIGPLELIRNAQPRAAAWPKPMDLLLVTLSSAALIAAAFFFFGPSRIMLWYLLGLLGSFAFLLAMGAALVFLARSLPKPENATLRFAVANLYREGTALPSIVLSLGLGLTLLVTLSLIDRSISGELRTNLASAAPSYFFIDVGQTEKADFLAALRREASVSEIAAAPMLRGRITKVKDVPASEVKAAPEGAWALRGDRGLTYADAVPPGSRLVEGAWWSKNYSGPPLVSLTADVAHAIGLRIGDRLSVNVLGRELTATIANLREVDWRSLGINFVMVFSPNTLSSAPHANLVTVTLPSDHEAAFLNRIISAFPAVTAVRVRDALDAVAGILGKLLLAIRGASALTMLSGLAVLAGALATSLSARIYDAVVLKTFGATRRQLMAIFALEFFLAGLATALFAFLMGSLAAYAFTRFVLEIPFDFSFTTAIVTALLSMSLTLLAGLATAWTALGARPAAYLRDD
jgi:putative ABC transport system permease protein